MTAPFPLASLGASSGPDVTTPLILALPKGRILSECGPLLARAGVVPSPDYADEDSRRLRFPTENPLLDVVRVRPFDVATFVAFGAAHIGICGAAHAQRRRAHRARRCAPARDAARWQQRLSAVRRWPSCRLRRRWRRLAAVATRLAGRARASSR